MSEELALEAFCDFLDAVEAGIAAAKQRIKERKLGEEPKDSAVGRWTWDPANIRWNQKSGSNGLYERSDDTDSPDFQALVKDLQAHRGKLMRDGLFYWLFTDQINVGRKLKQKK